MIFLLLVVLGTTAVAQTPIGGVVNRYAAVIGLSLRTNGVHVDDVTGFAPGDTVLLIAMQGASYDSVVGPGYGRLTKYNDVGCFERNIVDTIRGSVVVLRHRLSQIRRMGPSIQLVRMPTYRSARVVTDLRCEPWNGRTGGVLALTVLDTLFLQADVTASAMGFRGGAWGAHTMFTVSGGTPQPRDWASADSSCCFSARGEGLAADVLPLGIAAATSGGGGGASEFHGGGGGAHRGCGGDGGDAAWWDGNRNFGRGGAEASYTTGRNRIYMGGGGGATEQVAGRPAGIGGNGGGIVVIDVPVIVSDGIHTVRADGGAGRPGRSGGSGGGAGGAMLLMARSLVNVPVLSCRGGAGGDALRVGTTGTLCGAPGGGGGGGMILLGSHGEGTLFPIDASGGAPGTAASAPCPVLSAGYGCEGSVVFNSIVNQDTTPYRPSVLNVSQDTTICGGEPAVVSAEAPDAAVRIVEGQTILCQGCGSVTVRPQRTTTYGVIADWGDGSADTVNVVVTVLPPPTPRIVEPAPFCLGDSVELVLDAPYATYRWSNGATTPSIMVRTADTVGVTVVDDKGCTGTASVVTRYRDASVLSINEGRPMVMADGIAGRRHCETIPVRNTTDTTVFVSMASFHRQVEFSVPLAQFPLVLPPDGMVPCTVCFAADRPGGYTDTLIVFAGCGAVLTAVAGVARETADYARCHVLVVNDGEVATLLPESLGGRRSIDVFDVRGALVYRGPMPPPSLARGVYWVQPTPGG